MDWGTVAGQETSVLPVGRNDALRKKIDPQHPHWLSDPSESLVNLWGTELALHAPAFNRSPTISDQPVADG
jgi:hypothetical protein